MPLPFGQFQQNAQPQFDVLQGLPGGNSQRSMAEVQAEQAKMLDLLSMADGLMDSGYIPNSGWLGVVEQGVRGYKAGKDRKKAEKGISDLMREESELLTKKEREKLEAEAAKERRKIDAMAKALNIPREKAEGMVVAGLKPADVREKEKNPFDQYMESLPPEKREQAYAVKAGLAARPGGGTSVNIAAPMQELDAAIAAGHITPDEARRIRREKLGADLPLKDQMTRDDQAKGAFDRADIGLSAIDQLMNHPGLDTAVGVRGQVDPRNVIWGTDAKGAQALIEQLQGQTFLQGFESLKGSGQITEIEGTKATNAIARLQRSQSPEEFRSALGELRSVFANAKQKAGGGTLPDSQSGAPKAGEVVDGYRFRGGDPANPNSWERV